MNWRFTLPRVRSLMMATQLTRSAVVRGLICIGVALCSGCVVHDTGDDTKKRMEERARLQTVEPTYVAHYEVSLIEVQRSLSAHARFGDMKIAADPGKGLFMAEDQLMRILWTGPGNQLGFDLLNKCDTPVRILWDAAAYVDITGQSRRVIHSGVKLADRNSPQAPSVVPSKGSLNDIVYPSDHVSYYGNWSQRPMFPCLQEGYVCTDPERRLVAAHHGSVYRVLLPIEAGTETYQYTFAFKVNKAQVTAVKR